MAKRSAAGRRRRAAARRAAHAHAASVTARVSQAPAAERQAPVAPVGSERGQQVCAASALASAPAGERSSAPGASAASDAGGTAHQVVGVALSGPDGSTPTRAVTLFNGAPATYEGWDFPSLGRIDATVRPRRRGIGARLRAWQAFIVPFGPRERDWEHTSRWRVHQGVAVSLVAVVVLAIVASFILTVAARAGKAAGNLPGAISTVAPASGVIVQPAGNTLPATPAASAYALGAWVSSSTPTSGSVQVYVRLTRGQQPVSGVKVDISVSLPAGVSAYGPVATNAYGLATFNVAYGGLAGVQVPVTVSASATVSGTLYYAQTSFTPI